MNLNLKIIALFLFTLVSISAFSQSTEGDTGVGSASEPIASLQTIPVNADELSKVAESVAAIAQNPDSLKTTTDIKTDHSVTDFQCTNPITERQLNGFKNYVSVVSRKRAIELGVSNYSAGYNDDDLVYIQDSTQSAICKSTDGKTNLIFGRTIRTIISLKSNNSKFEFTLPVIAANATLNNISNSVEISAIGYSNPKMIAEGNKIFGEELNVETYQTISGIQKSIADIALKNETAKSIMFLGVVPTVESDDLSLAPITSFALASIADGRSCTWTKSRFPNDLSSAHSGAIDNVYNMILSKCSNDAPNDVQKAIAKSKILYRITVTKRS